MCLVVGSDCSFDTTCVSTTKIFTWKVKNPSYAMEPFYAGSYGLFSGSNENKM